MPTPKFSVGDRVVVGIDRSNTNLRPGIYTVTRTMPAAPGGYQYRVRNDSDTHERVLDEAVLRAA